MKGENSWPGPNHKSRRLKEFEEELDEGQRYPGKPGIFIHKACYLIIMELENIHGDYIDSLPKGKLPEGLSDLPSVHADILLVEKIRRPLNLHGSSCSYPLQDRWFGN
jgi:hypothetical protein